ncbi:uncharacterized protein [Asterias amurensis]|uniref:uncharacterized protein isoform X2 n=1 Tax=Asterias amurensis TaxID=7602 RepID=UPI003AB5235A
MSSRGFLGTRVSCVLILFFVTASNSQGGYDPYDSAGAALNGGGRPIPAAPYDVSNQGIGRGQGSPGGGRPAPAAPYDVSNQGIGRGQGSPGGGRPAPAAPYDVSNQGIGRGQGSPDYLSGGGRPAPAAPYDVSNQGIGRGQGSPAGGVPVPVAAPYDVINDRVEQVLSDWSEWSSWQMCSVTCGEGVQLRERRCGAPGSGAQCMGQDVESGKCLETPICKDGTFIQELHVLPMHTVVLNCYGKRYMREHPAAEVVWYRNDEPVQLRGSLNEGSRIRQLGQLLSADKYIVDTVDLKMTSVHLSDEGIYACAIFVPQEDIPTYSTVILLKVNQTSGILKAAQLQFAKLIWPICFPILLILTAACSMKVEIKRYKTKGMPPEVVEEIKQRKLENQQKKKEAKLEAKRLKEEAKGLKAEAKLQKKADKSAAAASAAPPPPSSGGSAPPAPAAPSAPAPPPPPGASAPPPPPGPAAPGPPPPPGPAAPGPPPPPGPAMMAPGPPAPAAPQQEMVPGPMALMMQQAPPSIGPPPPGPPMAPPPGPPGPPMAPPAGPPGPPMAPPAGPSGPPPPPPGGGGGGPPPPPPPPP